MSEPKEGTNIRIIWLSGLTDNYQTKSFIFDRIRSDYPGFPFESFTTHIKNLIKRGFASSKLTNGVVTYRHLLKAKLPVPVNTPYNSNLLIQYLQTQIGNDVTVVELNQRFSQKGTSIYSTIGVLEKAGKIALHVTINNRKHYTVLPLIDPNYRETTQVMNPDITQMSIGDIINNVMVLRDENLKYKQILESIGNLMVQAGIAEDEA